jgi:hypothetical protein
MNICKQRRLHTILSQDFFIHIEDAFFVVDIDDDDDDESISICGYLLLDVCGRRSGPVHPGVLSHPCGLEKIKYSEICSLAREEFILFHD